MFDPFTPDEAAEATGTLLDLSRMVAGKLDPHAMLPAEAMAQLKVVSAARKVLAGVEMALSARVADSEQWKGEGDDSAADRIAKETGKSRRQAKDDLATARRAQENEQLDQALKEGKVSPEQARAIGAAGEADPEATEDLLQLAEQGVPLGDLNEEAERIRREAEGEAHKAKARARAQAGRFARSWTKDEMCFLLLGVPVDVGAEVLARLAVERDHVFARDRRDGSRGTYENRSADALVNLILGRTADAAAEQRNAGTVDGEPAAASGPAPTAGGEPGDDPAQQDLFGDHHRHEAGTGAEPDRPAAPVPSAPGPTGPRPIGDGGRPLSGTSPPPAPSAPAVPSASPAPPASPAPSAPAVPSGTPPSARARSGPPRRSEPSGRIVARLDVAHLWGAPGDTTCEIAGIGNVSLEALSAALPEPWVQLVITRGKDVQNVTNIGRGADLWQQAALDWTHRGRCSNVACNRTAQIQNDHRTPWAQEQVTELANLDPFCTYDHRKKTHQGWALVEGTGRRAFVAPDDPRHPSSSHQEAAAS